MNFHQKTRYIFAFHVRFLKCTKSNFIKGKIVTSRKGIARDSLSRWPLQSQNPSASYSTIISCSSVSKKAPTFSNAFGKKEPLVHNLSFKHCFSLNSGSDANSGLLQSSGSGVFRFEFSRACDVISLPLPD